MSLDGPRALVGIFDIRFGGGPPVFGPGAAYFFHDAGAIWAQTSVLEPGDDAGNAAFGSAVSLSDGVALIGSRFDDWACPIDDADCNAGSATLVTTDGDCTLLGDCNNDGTVSLEDFRLFPPCSFTLVPGFPACKCFDFMLDGFVDVIDYGRFQIMYDCSLPP